MKKAPGWKTLGTAITAAMTMGLSANSADAPSQQSRPVLNQQPSQIERVQPRTSRNDSDNVATHNLASQDTASSQDSVKNQYQVGMDSVNTTSEPRESTTTVDTSITSSPSEQAIKDTIFVDGNTYSEPGNTEINQITNIKGDTADLTIREQTGDTTKYEADINTNPSLNTEQGRRALRNAGWTPSSAQTPSDDGTTLCFEQSTVSLPTGTETDHYQPITRNGEPVNIKVTDNDGDLVGNYVLAESPTNTPDSTAEAIANTPEDIINATRGAYASIAGDASTIDSPIEQKVEDQVKTDIVANIAGIKSYLSQASQNGENCVTTDITEDDIKTSYNNTGDLEDVWIDTDNPRHVAQNNFGVVYNNMDDKATPAYFAAGGLTGEPGAPSLIRPVDETGSDYIRDQRQETDTVTVTETETVTEKETVHDTVAVDKDNYHVGVGATTNGPTASFTVDVSDNVSVGIDADYDIPTTETQRVPGDVRGPLPTSVEQGGLTLPEGVYVQPVSQSQTTTSSIGANALLGYDVSDNVELQAGPGVDLQTKETTGKEYLRGDVTEEKATSPQATYQDKKDPLGGPYKESSTEVQPTLEAKINGDLYKGLGASAGVNLNTSTSRVTPEFKVTHNF